MTEPQIRDILEHAHTIAMVGASDKPDRDSYQVMAYLIANGYRVIPVNPTVETIQGERSYPTLAAIPVKVDIVDVFRRSDAVPPVVDEAIAIGAPVVWMQLGVVNEGAAQTARAAGMAVVMDRCMKVEHRRLIGDQGIASSQTEE
jgi:predicted CoA-binding protein